MASGDILEPTEKSTSGRADRLDPTAERWESVNNFVRKTDGKWVALQTRLFADLLSAQFYHARRSASTLETLLRRDMPLRMETDISGDVVHWPQQIVVNLSRIEYIDSDGLDTRLECSRQCGTAPGDQISPVTPNSDGFAPSLRIAVPLPNEQHALTDGKRRGEGRNRPSPPVEIGSGKIHAILTCA